MQPSSLLKGQFMGSQTSSTQQQLLKLTTYNPLFPLKIDSLAFDQTHQQFLMSSIYLCSLQFSLMAGLRAFDPFLYIIVAPQFNYYLVPCHLSRLVYGLLAFLYIQQQFLMSSTYVVSRPISRLVYEHSTHFYTQQ